MMNALVKRHLLAAALMAALLGCAGSPGAEGGQGSYGAQLELVGDSPLRLLDDGEHEVQIRYTDADDAPIADATVEVALEGELAGASLSGMRFATDDEGVATARLRTGGPARFELHATAPDAAPLRVDVEVEALAFGHIDVTPRYGGEHSLDEAAVAVFTNTSCASAASGGIAPADARFTTMGRSERFEVETRIPLAVYGLGIDLLGRVRAEQCLDLTLERSEEKVRLPLQDLGDRIAGSYELELSFDVTEGFGPELNTVLLALRVLGSPPADGAAHLVEWVVNNPSTPSTLVSALSDPTIRATVERALGNALESIHPPGFLDDLLRFGANAERMLSNLQFVSELRVGRPDEESAADAEHRLHTLFIPSLYTPSGETSIEQPLSASAPTRLELDGREMTLQRHGLPINFGRIVELLLSRVLPASLGSYASSPGELLRELLDCDALARRVGSGVVRDVALGVCNLGVEVLATFVEQKLIALWSYEPLELTCDAEMIDTDRDLDRDRIRMGLCEARWVGEEGDLEFTGTMEGFRIGDETDEGHPVLERIRRLD